MIVISKDKIKEVRERDIDEEIQRVRNVLEQAQETAGETKNSLEPAAFPRVAKREGYTSAWMGNALVASIEEELLELEELKAKGATSVEIDYTE